MNVRLAHCKCSFYKLRYSWKWLHLKRLRLYLVLVSVSEDHCSVSWLFSFLIPDYLREGKLDVLHHKPCMSFLPDSCYLGGLHFKQPQHKRFAMMNSLLASIGSSRNFSQTSISCVSLQNMQISFFSSFLGFIGLSLGVREGSPVCDAKLFTPTFL